MTTLSDRRAAELRVAADLFEHGRVTPESEAALLDAIGAETVAGLPQSAREALIDAYEADGADVPEWLL